jgi:hypothetical protein
MTNEPTDSTEQGSTLLSRRTFLAGAAAAGGAMAMGGLPAIGAADQEATTFTIRIENISGTTGTTLDPSGDASGVPVVLSPGAFAVHRRGMPIFTEGEPERDNGLEEIAEDGMPGRLAESLAMDDTVAQAGAFATPVGADGPGPLPPGMAYEFEFQAEPPAQYLSLVTMFVQSNDLFYALGGDGGMAVFDGMEPKSGDVTSQLGLWDAGTEINEEPGAGENQAPRQSGAGVGLVERDTVVPIEDVNGYDYPAAEDVVSVTLSPSE